MTEDDEQTFVEQFEAVGIVRLVARRLYRELHPKGMHTNGPVRLVLDASSVRYLLERWRLHSGNPVSEPESPSPYDCGRDGLGDYLRRLRSEP